MDLGGLLSAAMFISALGLLLFGFGVAFSLASVGLTFAALGVALDAFNPTLLNAMPGRFFAIMQNEVLVAVPLFIFMGTALERSGLAEEMLEAAGQLFGKLHGGLAVAVVVVGALLAASTGVVGAAVVTMGLISLPIMLRVGYDVRLATGTIAASATLAQVIPPSTVLIFLGVMLQTANSQAQMAAGNMAPDPVSIGDLFFGSLTPGLLLVVLYLLWIAYKARRAPASCPPVPQAGGGRAGLVRRTVRAMLPPLFLIIAVLGSILMGYATPTESAAVGAVGALALAAIRRRLDSSTLAEIARATARFSSMAFILLFGASVLMLVFRGLGGDLYVESFLGNLPGGLHGAMFVVMSMVFILGFFLDPFEIIFIMVPLSAPALITLGADPLWLGVLLGLNLQTSFLTPPFGFTLFYLRSVAPPTVRTIDIYAGIIPFVLFQIVIIAAVWVFPGIATALPRWMFGG